MLSTNDKKIYNRSRILAEQGKKNKKYEYHEIGYNLKMNNLSSSVGLAQIKRFNQIKKLKYSIKKKYDYFCKKNNTNLVRFLVLFWHSFVFAILKVFLI